MKPARNPGSREYQNRSSLDLDGRLKLDGTMTLWSPWGRELGAGGCYFAGSERSQFGIQRQFNQLISSLSLVHKHCARRSPHCVGSKTFIWTSSWWWRQLKLPALFTRSHELHVFLGKILPRVHLPDRFDCVIVPSTLRWAIADIICRFSHVRWIFTQLPIKPRCTSISDKGLPAHSAVRRNDTFLSASNSYGSSPPWLQCHCCLAEPRSSR